VALAGLARKLLHQARLADAGLPAQEEQGAAPLARLIERVTELGELRGPAHEGPTRDA
jgi:hypothetical protein